MVPPTRDQGVFRVYHLIFSGGKERARWGVEAINAVCSLVDRSGGGRREKELARFLKTED